MPHPKQKNNNEIVKLQKISIQAVGSKVNEKLAAFDFGKFPGQLQRQLSTAAKKASVDEITDVFQRRIQ